MRRFALLLLSASMLLAGSARAQPLTGPSGADPLEIVLGHLQAERGALGLSAGDLAGLVVRDRYVTRHSGATHLYLRQQVGGIEVFGSEASATVDREGRLVGLGERFVRGLAGRLGPAAPALAPAAALERAALHLGLPPLGAPELRESEPGPARRAVFAGGELSRDDIPVRLEYVVQDASVRLAWNAVIRTPDGRHWWNLHVDAETGSVLRQDDWVDRESYRVFPPPLVSPDEGPRALLQDVADPVASPFGWHDTDGVAGVEFTDTRGNNVFAQEDGDADDAGGERPDGGGSLVFDFPLDPTRQTGPNRDASIANLFYWNNVLHDVLYQYGFDEPAGNFQENNYGNGGADGDPVQADALDGSDTNNAQFSTPPDGFDGRMEMFRFELAPVESLEVHSPAIVAGTYAVGKALFGTATSGLTADVVAADDGTGTTTDACEPLVNDLSGRIAFIDRGTCFFEVKVKHAQDAGAVGAVVANNVAGPPATVNMSGTDASVAIPSVFISQSDGNAIRPHLVFGVSATIVTSLDRDSSFDTRVVVHEYGHGLSNRLVGGPSSAFCLDADESAGMGEGYSDWLALVFTAKPGDLPTDAQHVAPYLLGNPPAGPGIRNHPYSTDLGVSPLTYGDVSSLNRPHGVGEVWAAALWEMYWNLIGVYGFDPDLYAGQGGNNRALQLVVDGMKMPMMFCDPTFVDGRDEILNADAMVNGGAHRCLIWSAFAKRGIGLSASDGGGPNNLNVTEAFDEPAECASGFCGDALLQVGEECDDGGTDPGDGCSATCQREPPPVPALPPGGLLLSALALSLAARRLLRRGSAGAAARPRFRTRGDPPDPSPSARG